MVVVIFEVWLADGQKQRYLDFAAALRKELEQVDGFLSVKRFQSITEPDKLLSLSFWQDEAAVERWRNFVEHRAAQTAGRAGIFRDYRLRVAAVERNYGLNDRELAPADSRAAHPKKQ